MERTQWNSNSAAMRDGVVHRQANEDNNQREQTGGFGVEEKISVRPVLAIVWQRLLIQTNAYCAPVHI